MSERAEARRTMAEVRWDKDPEAVVRLGERSLHHFWPLLSAYFRDTFLAPHRRADEPAVTWTWREPANAKALSTGELSDVRKRLRNDQQLFAENIAREAHGLARGHANLAELATTMEAVIAQLVAKSDAELAGFVCRTEQGLRVHSWGARVAARPSHPDSDGCAMSGEVRVNEKPARATVILRTAAGKEVARMRTGKDGGFRFEEVAAGAYRVAAEARGAAFAAEGVEVEMGREAVTGIQIETTNERRTPATERGSRRGLRWGMGAAALIAAGIGIVWWSGRERTKDHAVATAAGAGTLGRADPHAQARGFEAGQQQRGPAPRSDASRPADTAGGAPGGEARRESGAAGHPTNVRVGASPPAADGREETDDVVLPGRVAGIPAAAKGTPLAAADPAGLPGGKATGRAGTQVSAGAGTAEMAEASDAAGPVTAPGAAQRAGSGGVKAPGARRNAARGPVESIEANEGNRAGQTRRDKLDNGSANEPEEATTPAEKVASAVAAEKKAETEAASRTAGEVARVEADVGEETRNGKRAEGTANGRRTGGEADAMAEEERRAPGGEATHGQARPSAEAWMAAEFARTAEYIFKPGVPRMLADSILPTLPRRRGETEVLRATRERVAQEEARRLPPEFLGQELRAGVLLAWSGRRAPAGVAWRTRKGGAASGTSVGPAAASVRIGQVGVWRLVTRQGEALAEVEVVEAGRRVVVRWSGPWHVKPWLGFVAAGAGAARAGRFEWQTPGGAPAGDPGEGAGGDTGAPGAAEEMRIVFGSTGGAGGAWRAALFDKETGWALVTEVGAGDGRTDASR